jgi:hypothetical protein
MYVCLCVAHTVIKQKNVNEDMQNFTAFFFLFYINYTHIHLTFHYHLRDFTICSLPPPFSPLSADPLLLLLCQPTLYLGLPRHLLPV